MVKFVMAFYLIELNGWRYLTGIPDTYYYHIMDYGVIHEVCVNLLTTIPVMLGCLFLGLVLNAARAITKRVGQRTAA